MSQRLALAKLPALCQNEAMKQLKEWAKRSIVFALGTNKKALPKWEREAAIVFGRKGAGKSGLLSTIAVQLFARHVCSTYSRSNMPGGTLIVDLMDACDGENLFWLALTKPFCIRWRRCSVIIVTGKDKVLAGPHMLYAKQVSWREFGAELVNEYLMDKKAVVVVNATITMGREELYDAASHILEEIRRVKPDHLWRGFIVVRELARLMPSRYVVSEKQRQTKKSVVHLLAELRHLKMGIGMDVQSYKMIDSIVFDVGADTLVLKPLTWEQIAYLRNHTVFKALLKTLDDIFGAPAEQVLLMLTSRTMLVFKEGDLFIGANALPPYYAPGYELVKMLNVRVVTEEELRERIKEVKLKTP